MFGHLKITGPNNNTPFRVRKFVNLSFDLDPKYEFKIGSGVLLAKLDFCEYSYKNKNKSAPSQSLIHFFH